MKQVKRMVCLCMALVMCLTLRGCDLEELAQLEIPILPTTTLPSVDVPMTLLDNGYAYTQLDEAQRENYEAVVETLYEKRGQDTVVDDEYGLSVTLPNFLRSEEEIKELYNAVADDHPEFFYLTPQYGWIKITALYSSIRFFYIWNADERAAKATELEAAVSSLVTQAQGMTALEQEMFFHDTLTERCEYNEAAAEESDNGTASTAYCTANTAYAALCTGDPICGGYSRAFQLLLARVGIPCTTPLNDDHMWNMVWLDGTPYHVDVTWDDPIEGTERSLYLNLTDEEIKATRDYPAQPREVPVATETAYNYHVMNDWYFTDAFDETLDDCIREQIENGNEYVELKFSPDAYIDAGSWLFDDEGFFGAVYELEDDALRDRWYSAILYEEDENLGAYRIYIDEEQQ